MFREFFNDYYLYFDLAKRNTDMSYCKKIVKLAVLHVTFAYCFCMLIVIVSQKYLEIW